jgi:hypothetical protein
MQRLVFYMQDFAQLLFEIQQEAESLSSQKEGASRRAAGACP